MKNKSRIFAYALTFIVSGLVLSACKGTGSQADNASNSKGAGSVKAANVNQARVLDETNNIGQWLTVGGTYKEQRYSPLTEINTETVSQLSLAWFDELGGYRGNEATPLFIDGVVYNTTSWNITTAYNAATGEKLWSYDPKVPSETGRIACCDIVTRGLAAWEGKIYVATLDGRLIALDAENGEPVWEINTLEGENAEMAYTITGAPRVFNGKVLIGNSGAELGVRGYVTAYNVDSGEQLWRFYTVPGNPADGFENAAMEMAAKTWTGEWWKMGGGGTAWDNMVYDPELNLIYIGTGNGSPWAHKLRSPEGGDNLFLSSIVAVNADTGEYVWHYQEVPGEQYDYTATQPMVLAELEIEGKERKVIMQTPKNGFLYVLDRVTGELLSAERIMETTWASHVDMETGRPVLTPEANYGEVPVLLAPSPGGAHNWNPISYNPETGLLYFSAEQSYSSFAYDPNWTVEKGGTGASYGGYADLRKEQAIYSDENTKAWLSAWDPVAKKEVWRVPYKQGGSGGTLTTAGNLVFHGTIDKTLAAYTADTGEKVWEQDVQTVPMAGPISYEMNGEQYIAVNAGWGGGRAHFQSNSFQDLGVSTAKLVVFKLGGTATLPPQVKDKVAPERPPLLPNVSPEKLKLGGDLFAANCAMCHGILARGGIKDLRFMSSATHKEFFDIVLRGSREKAGMANFSDKVSEADAQAIHDYLIVRAHEDWGNAVSEEGE